MLKQYRSCHHLKVTNVQIVQDVLKNVNHWQRTYKVTAKLMQVKFSNVIYVRKNFENLQHFLSMRVHIQKIKNINVHFAKKHLE